MADSRRRTSSARGATEDCCPRCGRTAHKPGGIGERNCKAAARWSGEEKVKLARRAVGPPMTATLLRMAERLRLALPKRADALSMHVTLWSEVYAAVELRDLPTQNVLEDVASVPAMAVESLGSQPTQVLANQQEIGAVVALRIADVVDEEPEPVDVLSHMSDAAGVDVIDRAADVVRCTLFRLTVDAEGLSGAAFVAESEPLVAEPFLPKRRASLPRLHVVTAMDAARLPKWDPGAQSPDDQLTLPGFTKLSDAGCPSFLLWAFDRAGGESTRQGRGASWELRLWIEALLGLHVRDRNGEWRTLPYPLSKIIDMLHPHGWANQRRDWSRLPEALHRMRELLGFVPVEGVGRVAMVFPSVIPEAPTDPGVEFTVRIPSSAARGAAIDIKRLRRYGVDSAVLYRAYLTMSALLDRAARRGVPITREIGRPELGDDGKPKRRKGGAVVRSDQLMPHPMAHLAPSLTDREAAGLIGFDSDNRDHRRRSREALERLDADKVIDVRACGRGRFQIFGPRRFSI